MSNIITISREFGSGGREVGKRLAEILGYDYYDREIITAIAERQKLDACYVERALENNHLWRMTPLTFRQSFSSPSVMHTAQTSLLIEQKQVIEHIGKTGRNCVIVGRNADVLLKSKHPFTIFVCADMESKIERCIKRAGNGEKLSRREIEQKIWRIDRNRAKTREIITGSRWGECGTYHLTVNTTDWDIRELSLAVSDFAVHWFRRS